MLDQRHRRWPSIEAALGQRIEFSGILVREKCLTSIFALHGARKEPIVLSNDVNGSLVHSTREYYTLQAFAQFGALYM